MKNPQFFLRDFFAGKREGSADVFPPLLDEQHDTPGHVDAPQMQRRLQMG